MNAGGQNLAASAVYCVNPALALELERIGWGDAAFWIEVQMYYNLAQELRRHPKAEA